MGTYPGRAPNYNPKGFASPPSRGPGRPPKTPQAPRGGRGIERSDFSSMSRTRPCLYCGKTFFNRDELNRHEQVEAREFEREAMHFEHDSKNKVNQTMFESSHPKLHRLIDRTDEEFGDEYRLPENLKIETQYPNDINYATYNKGYASVVSHPINQTSLNNSFLGVTGTVSPDTLKFQYNNHTSQYTSFERVGQCSDAIHPPPPAHGDSTTQLGFFPPPPPLPVPQFTQVCHKRSDAEFPDPNDDKTYTTLQSKDESQTRSSLLVVNTVSPNREVLDLSLPKAGNGPVQDSCSPAPGMDPAASNTIEHNGTELDSAVQPDSSHIIQPEHVQPIVEPSTIIKDDVCSDEMIFFEPSSMPSMPEANISWSETLLKPDIDHDDILEWKDLSEEYSGLVNPEEDLEESYRSQSPHQYEDHHRGEYDEEYEQYDGELTRLFCGFCGKTFKKAAYRMLHEKGHTGELDIACQFCDRKFRWKSELKSHNEGFCTAEKPARPQQKKTKFYTSNRHVDKDDWISNHSSMPTGWKIRSRPRPTQEGQMYFVYMSPEGQVFHSRKAVLQHMEKTGGYSIEDINKVRRSAKTGPRGRGKGSKGTRSPGKDPDLEYSNGNLDTMDADSMDNVRIDEDEDDLEGKSHLRLRTKIHLKSA